MKDGKGTIEADKAIIEASQGKVEIKDMLDKIISAQVFVPMSAPPKMEKDVIKSWQPATVTHPERGDYLVAFTDEKSRNNFIEEHPEYKLGMLMETHFLMGILPPGHGILFNIGGESCFEWDVRGISAYRQAISIKKKK